MTRSQFALPALCIALIMFLIVPMPTAVLDVVLAVNIITAVVILAAVIGVADPVEFSAFPTVLLVSTAARLALTVSTTRLILLDGYAGEVVETFGEFVVGSNVVVGLVIFAVLTIVNLMVITKGSERAAEVAARFSLDAMPGKQMAVDADLAAGLLDDAGARAARKRIARESDFYGAMDGAVKFVKGDAIASLIIVFINLIGGFSLGVLSQGMPIGEAMDTFSLLTVGDGLVAQIPALLIALATGMLVNRVRGEEGNLGTEMAGQLGSNPVTYRVGAFGAGIIGLLPGMPKVPFAVAAAGLWWLSTKVRATVADSSVPSADHPVIHVGADDPDALIAQMRPEPLELSLAFDCVDLVSGGDLTARVRELRRQLALELGFVLPHVVTSDDASLPAGTYRISVGGVPVGEGIAPAGQVLALPDPTYGPGDDSRLVRLGTKVTEPVFGLTGYWVPDELRADAAAAGATIVGRSSAIVTHLAEVSRSHSPALLTRQAVADLVEGLRNDQPLLANEIGNDRVPMAKLHQVLRELLTERVAVKDLARIVETIADSGPERPVEQLADECRATLGAQICSALAPAGRLAAVLLVPELEGQLLAAVRDIDGAAHLAADPELLEGVKGSVAGAWDRLAGLGDPVALICAPQLRRPLARALAAAGVTIDVLAYRELPAHLQISTTEVIGTVSAQPNL